MKTSLIAGFLFLASFSYSQATKAKTTIITNQKKVLAMENDFESIESQAELNCEILSTERQGFLFYLASCDPLASEENRLKSVLQFETRLQEISRYYDCMQGKEIYLKLTEGLLLTNDERKRAYSENGDVNSKVHNLHLKRFIENYGEICEKYFPGATIYVEEYRW